MNNRKSLTLSQTYELDVTKLMNDIDYLNVIVDQCDKGSVSEMWKVRNNLQLLSDKDLIGLAKFVTTNRRLEEIGIKFKKCKCIK